MLDWLLKTIGVTDDLLVRLDQAALAVQRPGLLWLGLALLVPVGWFIIRRQRQSLASTPPALRGALSATRIAVVALLVLVLAGPYLKVDYQVDKRPVVALLFDQSQSMQLPSGPFEDETEAKKVAQAADGEIAAEALNEVSRARLAQGVVRAAAKGLTEPLAERFDLRYYTFARLPERLGLDAAHPVFPEPPTPGGSSTRTGDALGRMLDDAAGRPVAGVLLFSDGQNTAGRSPVEAAAALARLGTPLYAVPTGSSTRLKDVAIVDVFTSGLVAVGDTAKVSVTVESQGFDGRPVEVELREGEEVLATQSLVLHDAEQQKGDLSFEAKEPGAKYLTVAIAPQAEEAEHLKANNSDVAFLRVSEGKIRVLLIDGLPRWDFRFLKNALRRDHGLAGRTDPGQVDVVLEAELRRQSPEARAKPLPATVQELAEYHAVILGDASPALVTPTFAALLAEAVRDHGLGLIVAAGPQFMPQAADERLKELLPVRLDPRAGGVDAPVYKPFHLELGADGATHEVMRLYDDANRNQEAWAQMPPYYWCAAAERPAPAASVLAWNPSVEGRYGKLPLIAYHYAGRGKVLFVGTDSTWAWRQNVGDRFFAKFWGQGVRFVARRDEKGAQKSWIEVRPVRVQSGEEAQVELMAIALDGTLHNERTLPVQLSGTGASTTLELSADPATKGRYTGRFTPQSAGEYRLAYDPGGGSVVEAKVRVMAASEELRRPNVNRAALALLASATGGRVIELPDLASVRPLLKGESRLTSVHREATLWDNGLVLVILMVLYLLDVALRRLAGLS